jgi:hypothetical protein
MKWIEGLDWFIKKEGDSFCDRCTYGFDNGVYCNPLKNKYLGRYGGGESKKSKLNKHGNCKYFNQTVNIPRPYPDYPSTACEPAEIGR